MPDPLATVAATELPHETLLGLRRRHDGSVVFQYNNNEGDDDDEANDPTGGGLTGIDTENGDENGPQNNRRNLSSQQASTGNPSDGTRDNANLRNTGPAAEEISPTTNLFSPLSGSIGIGMFRISRLYCFLSVISAILAIVLPPISTQMIEYHNLAAMMHDGTEWNGLVLKSSSIERTPIETENGHGRPDVKKNIDIVNNMNSIVADLKAWSVEEFITHAAFMGLAAARNREDESSKAGVNSNDRDYNGKREAGKKQRKRRRWPAVSKKRDHNVSSEKVGKKRTRPGHENRNDDNSQVPVGRLRNWIERINALVEDSLTEIIQLRKEKLEVAVEDTIDDRKVDEENSDVSSCDREGSDKRSMKQARRLLNDKWQWIDPIFLEDGSFADIFTNVIDKILKSTSRLCIITNFLLTMTYLLHSAVAAWFLSHSGASNNLSAMQRQHEASVRDDPARMISEWSVGSPSGASLARERMGGFLIFKLLLISAVLTPDTLDLMILVTWFTLLGCLRSLDHLAHSTNIHLTAIGQPPKKGIVQLLLWVLACDIVAAGSCVALFHTAGFGMVLLLTCDCALLGTDAASHILKYYQSTLESSHDNDIRNLEERQLNLHRFGEGESAHANIQNEEGREEAHSASFSTGEQEETLPATATMTLTEIRQESGRLDRQMESLELAHSRRVSVLDTGIFCLDMTCHILTVAHFCHIWALHGVQFTLIDGVLALHLHSAIATACAKLARRRNVHKITRDLEGHFPNATDEELKHACADGDVCCICLGSMTKGGNVKKVHCGHIYHTHCLREVIERAQNLQSAKCPLCRAPLVAENQSNGSDDNNNFIRQNNTPISPHMPTVQEENRTINLEIEGHGGVDTVPVRQVEGERALFRFSTEGILPVWLPLPAFSFEVVRRPPLDTQRPATSQNQQVQTTGPASQQRIDPTAILSFNQGEDNSELQTEYEIQAQQLQEQEQDTQVSFMQRVLLFTGLMPMSPEAEARALEQLVDMFPQYDRSDLLRELRNRGSLEAVTEAILVGSFPGVPRGE